MPWQLTVTGEWTSFKSQAKRRTWVRAPHGLLFLERMSMFFQQISIQHLLIARFFSTCFANTNLCVINDSMKWVLWLYPFTGENNQGPGRLSDLPEVTEPVGGGAWV